MKLKDLIEKYGEYEVLDNGKPVTTATKKDVRGFTDVLYLKKPKPKTVWDLRIGEEHAWVDGLGKVKDKYSWRGDESSDPMARDVGNIFLTKEEAEKDVERRKVETLLLKHGGRRCFKKDKENWFITFDQSVCLCFSKYTIRDPRQGTIYFDTEEQLKKAFEQIGEDRIINALFEVR